MDDAGATFSIQRKKKEQQEFKLRKNTVDKFTKSLHNKDGKQIGSTQRGGGKVMITEEGT